MSSTGLCPQMRCQCHGVCPLWHSPSGSMLQTIKSANEHSANEHSANEREETHKVNDRPPVHLHSAESINRVD